MQRYARETGLRYEAPSLIPVRALEFLTLHYSMSMRRIMKGMPRPYPDCIEVYRHDAKHWLDLSKALRRGEACAADMD